jgi:hypothetical protein
LGKRKFDIELYTYGEYSTWDRTSKALPRILNITGTIEAEIGTEFGYVLRIRKAKGSKIFFRIIHPPFQDEKGNVMDDFTWRLITELDGKVIADKTLWLVSKNG